LLKETASSRADLLLWRNQRSRVSHRLDSTNSRIAAITPQCCSRSTDQTAADADAVGLGAGALAGFKAEAQLTSAAIAAGRDMTPQLTAKIKDLADNARDAADDLAKVQLASVISRGTQTAFLSPEDVTIANQLKTVFGDDIPKALNSSQAAALRMNNVLSTISR